MKLNTFRIFLIIVILIALITIIVIGIIFLIKHLRKRKKKKKEENEISRTNSTNSTTQPSTNLSLSQSIVNIPREVKINAFCECFLKPIKFNKINIYNESCPIDLVKFEEDNEISVTKCYHGFHYECIKKYMVENDKNKEIKCPICLTTLFSLDDKVT